MISHVDTVVNAFRLVIKQEEVDYTILHKMILLAVNNTWMTYIYGMERAANENPFDKLRKGVRD